MYKPDDLESQQFERALQAYELPVLPPDARLAGRMAAAIRQDVEQQKQIQNNVWFGLGAVLTMLLLIAAFEYGYFALSVIPALTVLASPVLLIRKKNGRYETCNSRVS